MNYRKEIETLAKEKNAVILAHYYQSDEIQELAHFVGDSLELSMKARESDADIIVFCGVHFMAETAKILNPEAKVLLPDLEASCSLSESCPTTAFEAFLVEHPDHVVVSYINCSAEIKALSDLICTSANAEKIILSIPHDKKIIFAPDRNLGQYLIEQTGRDMLLWDGACLVHEAFSIQKLIDLWKEHKDARLIAHPESEAHLLNVADFVGSTSKMLDYVQSSPYQKFIVATEVGILKEMAQRALHATLIPAPAKDDNTCACSECYFMKMNTLEKLYNCLKNETPEIILDEKLRLDALAPLEKMFEVTKGVSFAK